MTPYPSPSPNASPNPSQVFRSASGPEVGEGEGAAGLHFPPATPGEQTGLADLHDSDLGGRTSELEEEEERQERRLT